MRVIVRTILAGAVLATSASAFAARPTSIVFDSHSQTENGIAFTNYLVKCTNGKKQPLTAWENRKKWCVGLESSEDCQKKQVRAAQAACKAS